MGYRVVHNHEGKVRLARKRGPVPEWFEEAKVGLYVCGIVLVAPFVALFYLLFRPIGWIASRVMK